MPRALTVGSAVIDTITILNPDKIERISFNNAHSQFLLVEPGHKIDAQAITLHVGGGALNTAVALSRLGYQVSPLVRTGDDVERERILSYCIVQGLHTGLVRKDDLLPTGASVMIASHDRNAAIFTRRGANTALDQTDVQAAKGLTMDKKSAMESGKPCDLVHIAPLSGDSTEILPDLLEMGMRWKAFISVNPGRIQLARRARDFLDQASKIDLLSINRIEAGVLAPILAAYTQTVPPKEDNNPGDPATPSVIQTTGGAFPVQWILERLVSTGIKSVCLTDGGQGSYYYSPSTPKLLHQPIVKVQVKGTAGAGDGFVATLAARLAEGSPPEQALKWAAHNAAAVVQQADTTSGLMHFDQLVEISR